MKKQRGAHAPPRVPERALAVRSLRRPGDDPLRKPTPPAVVRGQRPESRDRNQEEREGRGERHRRDGGGYFRKLPACRRAAGLIARAHENAPSRRRNPPSRPNNTCAPARARIMRVLFRILIPLLGRKYERLERDTKSSEALSRCRRSCGRRPREDRRRACTDGNAATKESTPYTYRGRTHRGAARV